MDTFTYVDANRRERHIAWIDNAPHLRSGNGWRAFVPTPVDLRRNSALAEWLLRHAKCAVCGEPIDLITMFTGCTRGTWPKYDTARCRETAQKRRYRARAKEDE